MKTIYSALFASLFLIFPSGSKSQEKSRPFETQLFSLQDAERKRSIPIKVYIPSSKVSGDKKSPVIIFSHGLGGSRFNSAYLGGYWARSGYIGVFLQHAGSDQEIWKGNKNPSEQFMAMMRAVSREAFMDRVGDVTFVLDQMEKWNAASEHPLSGKMDLDRIGMCGHSYGGFLTQAMMGCQYPEEPGSLEEKRFKAFFIMSPTILKVETPEKGFGKIAHPVLCMTGTEDANPLDANDPPSNRRKVYEAMPAGDKYELVFDGGSHFAFAEYDMIGTKFLGSDAHKVIQKVSKQFWDAYLKYDEDAKVWLQSEEPRKTAPFKEKDIWIWK